MNAPIKSILLVEDEKFYFKPLLKRLQDAGYKVELAKNGKEGLEKSLSIIPDLILLDVIMPIMNGVDMLSYIRKHKETEKIPVLMLSILDLPQHDKVVTNDSACIYINKPLIPAEKVVAMVNEISKVKETLEPSVTLTKEMLFDCKTKLHIQ